MLGHRMRGRWRTVAELWEVHKQPNTTVDLLSQVDYMGKLSGQLAADEGFRLVYASSGHPTAAVLSDGAPVVDYTLFRVRCETSEEAHFLASVINTRTLEHAVAKWMPKGQFGSRHLQKHLWRLPIPIFDSADDLHAELAVLGAQAESEAAECYRALSAERSVAGKPTTIATARRELRAWLQDSALGNRINGLVERLLARSCD